MSARHSPAPWALNSDGDAILDANSERIAELLIDHNAPDRIRQFDANGRTMVAAPLALDSLAKLVTWAETYARANGIDAATSTGPLASDIAEARAILARAKGTT